MEYGKMGMKKPKGMKKEANMTMSGMGNTMPMGKATYHRLSDGKRTKRKAM